ncbi:cell division protein FtsQ/DivIB [Actinocorallia populi]|uniref:cell division protein FtsQ/DivIB n=1 Tax=Actinocorallia populi TaxID=2079200 RepID=UPI000D08DED3|nr:FtsQ-type POTRA domain-containing protein [Actinocorallia populi]
MATTQSPPSGGGPDSEPGEVPGRPRRARWKALFVALLITALLGTAVWVVLGSKLLVVREVAVRGTSLLERDRLLETAQVPLGTPMARLDAEAIERRVRGVREVESVSVTRSWPTTLVIAVRERTPIATVEQNGLFQHVDRFGVTVLTSPARPSHLPLLVVAAPGAGDPSTREGLAVLRELPRRWKSKLVTIEALSAHSVVLRLESGLNVVWGAAGRADEKHRLLTALLATKAGRAARTIDVSAPEVVTTR